MPNIPGSDELKTKPTQHSFKELMSNGIKTDVIIVRSNGVVTDDLREKFLFSVMFQLKQLSNLQM